jgi:cell division septal protein FtsQ
VRPFWILIIILLAAVSFGAYYAAGWPGFHPRRIAVSGLSAVSKAEVLQRAAINPGRNVWLQDTGAAAYRIAAIPYVKTVQIRRRLPADVTIVVTERKPFAIVADGALRMLVDDDLRVLDQYSDRTDMPELRWEGPGAEVGRALRARRLVQMAADCRALLRAGVPVATLSIDNLGNLNARLASGVWLEFGDDGDIAHKARLVNPILSQVPKNGRRVRALDLRAPKTPVLVFMP